MRQMAREIHRVLAGAGADFEHVARGGKILAQHRQYRTAVAFAGF
jgi:hypothetical protein